MKPFPNFPLFRKGGKKWEIAGKMVVITRSKSALDIVLQ
jgi:hypothetical protein